MKPRPADHGFSLLELAISLAVAAVFLAILLPALSTARVSTHRARCAGNQRLLGEAWTHCLEDGGGAFPMIAVQPGWRYGGGGLFSGGNAPLLAFPPPPLDDPRGRTPCGGEHPPPLAPTEGTRRPLAMFSQVSRALGYGEVTAVDPRNAGAADVSFTAGFVDTAIDGLGPGEIGRASCRERV